MLSEQPGNHARQLGRVPMHRMPRLVITANAIPAVRHLPLPVRVADKLNVDKRLAALQVNKTLKPRGRSACYRAGSSPAITPTVRAVL